MSDIAGNSGGQGQAPAGWYTVEDKQRYWDGSQWTEHFAPLPGEQDQQQNAATGTNPQASQQAAFGQQAQGAQAAGQQAASQQAQGAQAAGQQAASQQAQGAQAAFGQQAQGAQAAFGQQAQGAQAAFDQQTTGDAGFAQQGYGQTASAAGADNSMAMFAHLGGIVGILPSLLIWVLKKSDSEFIANHARKALNFQLTLLIAIFGMFILFFVFLILEIGFLVAILSLVWTGLYFANIAFSVIGGLAANKGNDYNYPFSLNLIK